ncbi:MAG: nucleotidyltransferase domain-containing protein [Bacteroidia bacterium]|nr:nucleotidyltransferase domain-containing protein [Bacteroidia bacterium]
MGQSDVIASVRKYKERVLSRFDTASVYLFGSYGRNTARPDSDIDVAVIVPEVREDFMDASAALWSMTWDVNTLIEPVLIDSRYPSPLYEEILRNGILV